MKEFTKSLFSYSLAMAFFGLKQVDNVLSPAPGNGGKPPAIRSLDRLTTATTGEFGEMLKAAFRSADNFQRGMVELSFDVLFPFAASRMSQSEREQPTEPAVAEPRRWTEAVDPLSSEIVTETVYINGQRT
jgi:hypothetical protein